MIERVRAALPRRVAGWRRGRFVVHEESLARNLSYVLHERSDSPAVATVIRRVRTHQHCTSLIVRVAGLHLVSDVPDSRHSPAPGQPDVVLTATLGLPRLLPAALKRVGWSGLPVVAIDDADRHTDTVLLFRAEARVLLPSDTYVRVVVCALILRPGARSAHLRVAGTFGWPDQRGDVLSAIEQLIQAYHDQWMPSRALWSAPAEALLAGEVT